MYAEGSSAGGALKVCEVLEVSEVTRRVLSAYWRLRSLRNLLEVLEVPEVMRRVLFCMLEAVERVLCLLEVLGVVEVRR